MQAEGIERVNVGSRELEVVRIPARRPGLPELVFLHEGLGSAGLWRGFPAALAASTGCGATVFSRYGNGFSDVLTGPRPPSYMHDEALAALPALFDRLGLHQVALVGHSDGASIATIFAAEYPASVRALILEAPHLFVEDLSVRSIAAMRERYASSDLRARMARHHADADATFFGWNDVWLSPEFRSWNVEDYAARVRAPVLAIQGLDDEYGTLAQIDALERSVRAPVDRLLLAGCGHAPHRDRAALVEPAASAWLHERMAA